jgi:hypothetical protein
MLGITFNGSSVTETVTRLIYAECLQNFKISLGFFLMSNRISKKTLSEKYHNVGIKVLRSEVLRKNAIMYFNEDGFELEFNVKKTKEKYYEHIESINSVVKKMREKRDIPDAISLSH